MIIFKIKSKKHYKISLHLNFVRGVFDPAHKKIIFYINNIIFHYKYELGRLVSQIYIHNIILQEISNKNILSVYMQF